MAKKNPRNNPKEPQNPLSGPAGAAKGRHAASSVVGDGAPPDDPPGSEQPPEVANTPTGDGTPTQPTDNESRQSTPLIGIGDDSTDDGQKSSSPVDPMATPPSADDQRDWTDTGDPADQLDNLWRGTQDILSTFEARMNSADIVAKRALNFSARGLRESTALLQSSQETREEFATAVNDLRDRLLRSRKAYGVTRPLPGSPEPQAGDGSTTPRGQRVNTGREDTPLLRVDSPLGDEDYADPNVSASVSQVFRDRDEDEPDSAYNARLNAQGRFRAAYEADQRRREREDHVRDWDEGVQRDHARRVEERARETPPHLPRTRSARVYSGAPPPGPPDGGGDDDDDNDAGANSDRGDRRPPPRPNRGHPGRGGRGGGRRPHRAPDREGPPSDDPHAQDEDDGSDRDRRRPSGRRRTRSPSYLRSVYSLPPRHPSQARSQYIAPAQEDTFKQEALRMIRTMIYDKLGTSMGDSPVLKNLKNIPAPEKYSGDDDFEIFESWLKGLLRWMRLYRLGGPHLEEEQLQILGSFLKGKAVEWYNDIVISKSALTR